MDEKEIERRLGEYLRGYSDGYKAGVEYSLKTVRDMMREKGLIGEESEP